MIKIYSCIGVSILLSNFHNFFAGSEMAWIVHSWSLQAIIFIWLCVLFTEIDKKNIAKRSAMAMAIIFHSSYIMKYAFWHFMGVNAQNVLILYCLIAIGFWICHVAFRRYDYNSDNIKQGNIHLCFWRPEKKGKSVFLSTVGAPFGSVAIYGFERLWGFKWSQKGFMERTISEESIEKKYFVIDTGVPETLDIQIELCKIVGAPAKSWRSLWLRINCVNVLKPVLRLLGSEFIPSFIECIPSIYAQKIINLKDKK